jgi:hypothetical protein
VFSRAQFRPKAQTHTEPLSFVSDIDRANFH